MGNLFSSKAYVEVFPNVHLPEDEPLPAKIRQFFDLNWYTVHRAIFTYALTGGSGSAFVGKEKTSDSLDEAQQIVIKKVGLKVPLEIEGYALFGTNNHVKNLCLLLKTNPWMAMALIPYGRDGFELKAFDENEKNPNLFLQIMRTMTVVKNDGAGGRVNFKFDAQLNILKFEAFDANHTKVVVEPDSINFWAAAALYNLVFFASAVHATMHVLHFLLTSALDVATYNFTTLNIWAETYDDNIANKYLQVFALLINDPSADGAIITGRLGFGASELASPTIREILKDNALLAWSKCTSLQDFLDLMFHKKVLESSHCLTEFKKHVALIPQFSTKCVESLSKIDSNAFHQSETHLATYLGKCGDFGQTNKITTIKSWIEIMCVTGIIHGSTLSYTRLLGVADIVKWRNISQEKWDEGDQQIISTGLGTISGMETDRHVMTASLTRPSFFNFKKIDPAFQKVLEEFDTQVSALKEAHKQKLLEDIDTLKNFGFILTDFAPDNFDSKQCTIATYI
uniref:Lipoxygenase domain-containing protein n=1 Tax=Aureoumbra lagunensis TaxID=44058 RepID=A0A7S3JRI4_9STRA|mmetsp:Transcript_18866/g.28457  ORF Transcript_18866/g.28457 Transcript_18866/m.28457 type:complete len:511 (+) Transcript_18866:54-1586(+)